MKRENVVCRQLSCPVMILDRVITEIHFDLKHIQHGWNKATKNYNTGPARNNYTEQEVIGFFEQLNFLSEVPGPQQTSIAVVDKRFVFYIYDKGKKLKMVVDFMKTEAIVVVTIHQVV